MSGHLVNYTLNLMFLSILNHLNIICFLDHYLIDLHILNIKNMMEVKRTRYFGAYSYLLLDIVITRKFIVFEYSDRYLINISQILSSLFY